MKPLVVVALYVGAFALAVPFGALAAGLCEGFRSHRQSHGVTILYVDPPTRPAKAHPSPPAAATECCPVAYPEATSSSRLR